MSPIMRSSRPSAPTSRSHVSSRKRVVGLLAAGVLALPVVASNAGSASAGPRQLGEGDYYAGSTIPAHESTPRSAPRQSAAPDGVPGIDVSHWQGSINWNAVANDGIKFAYIKATGSTRYPDSRFDENYVNAYNAGIIRGAYHFARPNHTGPVEQARYFVNNGGGWSADGKTLPPMLDMEYNPSGGACYGKSDGGMVNWIRGFSNEVERLTGRYPVIYTTRDWWVQCTGNSGAFNDTNPLMIARWGSSPYPLPNWPFYTVWQYTSEGSVAGISGNVDRDVFNGSLARLKAFARCSHDDPCRILNRPPRS